MRIQVLVSTMNQKDIDLLSKMNISSDAVVINQCDKNNKEEFDWQGHKIIWINTLERGLSKSRNMAIKESTSEICLFADDDEEFVDGYSEIVLNAFNKNAKASFIQFEVEGIEKKFKDYPKDELNINIMKSMKMSSVEIAIKRADIINNKILFDELIGSGTPFLMGEENAFIFECFRKNLKGVFVPAKIANLHIGDSTWFTGYNKEYFIGRGAAFTSMSRKFSYILMWQFALRKKKLYSNKYRMFEIVEYMSDGKKQYLNKKYKNNIKEKR